MGRAWHIQDIRKDIDKGNQRTLWWFLNLPETPEPNNAGSQPKVIRMVLSHVEQFHWSPRVHSLTCDLLSLQFPRWVHWLPSLRLVEGQIIHKAKRYLCSLFRECHNARTLENHSYFHLQKEKNHSLLLKQSIYKETKPFLELCQGGTLSKVHRNNLRFQPTSVNSPAYVTPLSPQSHTYRKLIERRAGMENRESSRRLKEGFEQERATDLNRHI